MKTNACWKLATCNYYIRAYICRKPTWRLFIFLMIYSSMDSIESPWFLVRNYCMGFSAIFLRTWNLTAETHSKVIWINVLFRCCYLSVKHNILHILNRSTFLKYLTVSCKIKSMWINTLVSLIFEKYNRIDWARFQGEHLNKVLVILKVQEMLIIEWVIINEGP